MRPNITDEVSMEVMQEESIIPSSNGNGNGKAHTLLKLGFDFGTNTSILFMETGDGKEIRIPSVVGYAREGTLPGILPRDEKILFGNEAIQYRNHLQLRWPLDNGSINEPSVATDFLAHIREIVDPSGHQELWAVIGTPAHASADKIKILRLCGVQIFERVFLVSEPFLAAVGMRDESRANDPDYADPCRSSLVVDIGAGTTDFCRVQGYFPRPEDQTSIPRAGNRIDSILHHLLENRYPGWNMVGISITALKERFSFVGDPPEPCIVEVLLGGKRAVLDITEQIKESCESLLVDLLNNITTLIETCDADAVRTVMKNIILTGGGSQIRNLAGYLESALNRMGYEDAKVTCAKEPKKIVAAGALRIARVAQDSLWQLSIRK